MRIAFIQPDFLPGFSESAFKLPLLASELAWNGHAVSAWVNQENPHRAFGVETFFTPPPFPRGLAWLSWLKRWDQTLRNLADWSPELVVFPDTRDFPLLTRLAIAKLKRLTRTEIRTLPFLSLPLVDPTRIKLPRQEAQREFFAGLGLQEEQPVVFHAVLPPASRKHAPVTCFGHLFSLIEACNRGSSRLDPPVILALGGMSQKQLELELQAAAKPEIKPWILALGPLQEKDLSLWTRRADLVASPYLRGVSKSRGLALAAFAHGRAVATTLGEESEESFPWTEVCAATPAQESERFVENARHLLAHPELRTRLAAQAKALYDRELSPSALANPELLR